MKGCRSRPQTPPSYIDFEIQGLQSWLRKLFRGGKESSSPFNLQRRMRHRSINSTLRYIHLAITEKDYEAVAILQNEKQTIVDYLKDCWEWVGQTKDYVYLRKPKTE